ncbi:hypothetical protein HYH03_009797 [Edaphochlamys debaryana]|uniref:Uncharacterized protein n=1 Tax=Edaphochlamys debaryana TaxID=47281 RepID=A0A835Y0I3_9CHLO|nr:hypothetical protein HYH03_009797 [Edaphochlamys debaryana]|eukprot:KAG2491841.1 hypothetical protein HYH03_009797 [Edaphochlamys debaryana]
MRPHGAASRQMLPLLALLGAGAALAVAADSGSGAPTLGGDGPTLRRLLAFGPAPDGADTLLAAAAQPLTHHTVSRTKTHAPPGHHGRSIPHTAAQVAAVSTPEHVADSGSTTNAAAHTTGGAASAIVGGRRGLQQQQQPAPPQHQSRARQPRRPPTVTPIQLQRAGGAVVADNGLTGPIGKSAVAGGR